MLTFRTIVIAAILVFLCDVAAAQFIVRPESRDDERCRMSSRVPEMVTDFNNRTGIGYTVASIFDTQGRCTLQVNHAPFKDPLYDEPRWNPERIEDFMIRSGWGYVDGNYYTMDQIPSGWAMWEVVDHLRLRAGYVAVHNQTHTYVYFHRYGHAIYIATHVGLDQWALWSPNGRYYFGVIYAADPPWTNERGLARVDERLIVKYPFLYQYQFPMMAPPIMPMGIPQN